MDFSQKFTQLRKKNNLTQESLASKLAVSRKTISNWEHGRNFPDIETLIKISIFFNVSLDSLLKNNIDILKHYQNETAIVKKNRLIVSLSYYLNIMFLVLSYLDILNVFPWKIPFFPVLLLMTVSVLLINFHDWHSNLKHSISIVLLSVIFLFMNTILLIRFNFSHYFKIQNAFSDGQLFGIILNVTLLTISILCILFLHPYPKSVNQQS